MKSDVDLYRRAFSHIYVEEAARAFPDTQALLKRFAGAQVIGVEDYKEVFLRKRQDWREQKRSQKLILAVKKGRYLYESGSVIPELSAGNGREYYTSPAMNCVYDCEYCYLQALYPSANLVIFVNYQDFFKAVDEKLLRERRLSLALSYDTDLLALESLLPLCRRWIEFAQARPNLNIEIRSKSANVSALLNLKPAENVIPAWTLSPQAVAGRFERGAPPLAKRLESIAKVQRVGWKVRLCFDPVLAVDNWREHYQGLIEQVFAAVDPALVRDAYVAGFRLSRSHLKKFKKVRPASELLRGDFVSTRGVVEHGEDRAQTLGIDNDFTPAASREVEEYVAGLVARHLAEFQPLQMHLTGPGRLFSQSSV